VKRQALALTLLALLPLAMPVAAEPYNPPPPLPPNSTMDPTVLQQQQMPMQQEEQREERDAGSQALTDKQHELVHQCRLLLRQQSRFAGDEHILTIKLVEDEKAYFKGRFVEPDANGQPQVRRYRCQISPDRTTVESVSVGPVAK